MWLAFCSANLRNSSAICWPKIAVKGQHSPTCVERQTGIGLRLSETRPMQAYWCGSQSARRGSKTMRIKVHSVEQSSQIKAISQIVLC
jgi:hypothetical protein